MFYNVVITNYQIERNKGHKSTYKVAKTENYFAKKCCKKILFCFLFI